MQNPSTDEKQRISRREQLEEWKKKKAQLESGKKSKTPVPKIIKFEEMLRNSNVTLYKPPPKKMHDNAIMNNSRTFVTPSKPQVRSTSLQKHNRAFGSSVPRPFMAQKADSHNLPSIMSDSLNLSQISDYNHEHLHRETTLSQEETIKDLTEKIDEIYENSINLHDRKWVEQFRGLFKNPNGSGMKHISFRQTVLVGLDSIGQALLSNGKVWLLWIKTIENILKVEDRLSLYKETQKFELKDGTADFIKADYLDFIHAQGIEGDKFLNYVFFEKEATPILKKDSQEAMENVFADDAASNIAEPTNTQREFIAPVSEESENMEASIQQDQSHSLMKENTLSPIKTELPVIPQESQEINQENLQASPKMATIVEEEVNPAVEVAELPAKTSPMKEELPNIRSPMKEEMSIVENEHQQISDMRSPMKEEIAKMMSPIKEEVPILNRDQQELISIKSPMKEEIRIVEKCDQAIQVQTDQIEENENLEENNNQEQERIEEEEEGEISNEENSRSINYLKVMLKDVKSPNQDEDGRSSKKRKQREFDAIDKENLTLENLKRVHLNETPMKSGQKKELILVRLTSDVKSPGASRRKRISMGIPEKYGSGMKYSIISIKDKEGTPQQVLTPVRASRRISSITPPMSKASNQQMKSMMKKEKSVDEDKSISKLSVKFIEDNEDLTFFENPIDQIFKPLDDETARVKELLKNRKPTPFSKSRRFDSDEEEDDEDKVNIKEIEGVNPLHIDFSRSEIMSQLDQSKLINRNDVDSGVRKQDNNFGFTSPGDKNNSRSMLNNLTSPIRQLYIGENSHKGDSAVRMTKSPEKGNKIY